MLKKRHAYPFMIFSSVGLLVACSQAAPLGPPSPRPSAPVFSARPITPVSSPSPSLVPTPVSSDTPKPISSSSPSPSLPGDVSVFEPTTLNGMIYDDAAIPLSDVTIRVRSLSSLSNFDFSAQSLGGTYALNAVPAGIQLEISASKAGYTTRKRVVVLKSNKNGNPDANRYDFGTDGGASDFGVSQQALSDKPEVVALTPARYASAIATDTPIVLRFSEAMDRKTVLDNVEIRAFSDEKLSVDNSSAPLTLTGSGTLSSLGGTRIWDKSAFEASWNADDTELTLRFREGRALPSDKDTAKVPDYQVSLERLDGQIKDKKGVTRNNLYFKLTDGTAERSAKFAVVPDSVPIQLQNIQVRTAENGYFYGDAIHTRFSERMVHYTLGPTLAGGMSGLHSAAAAAVGTSSAEQAALNYTLEVSRNGNVVLGPVKWGGLGGRAIFDTLDPLHQTVLLLPAQNTLGSVTGLWLNGQSVLQNGSFSTNASDDAAPSDDQAILRLIRPDGSAQTLNLNLPENLADNVAVASALQQLLNTAASNIMPASSMNPFSVTASASQLSIKMLDHSGHYIGWQIHQNFAASGPVLQTSPLNYGLGQSLDLFQPGDKIHLRVANTVTDPAGQTVDVSANESSASAS